MLLPIKMVDVIVIVMHSVQFNAIRFDSVQFGSVQFQSAENPSTHKHTHTHTERTRYRYTQAPNNGWMYEWMNGQKQMHTNRTYPFASMFVFANNVYLFNQCWITQLDSHECMFFCSFFSQRFCFSHFNILFSECVCVWVRYFFVKFCWILNGLFWSGWDIVHRSNYSLYS